MGVFVSELPRGDRYRAPSAHHRDLAKVEAVPAFRRFIGNAPQIGGDGADRIPGLSKPIELWVMPVAYGLSQQDLLGQQRLAPECDKSCAVE